MDFASPRSVNYIPDILRYRGVNYIRARARAQPFPVNNNIRLTDMQIFIVYAHVYDLIVPVQIIIRFYPSSAGGGSGDETHFEICLFMGELHLQIRLPAINRVIRLHSSCPDISAEKRAPASHLLFISFRDSRDR